VLIWCDGVNGYLEMFGLSVEDQLET